MKRVHNKRGNCHAVRDRNYDYVDTCNKHESIRGDCDECPPCAGCDGDRIDELEQTLATKRRME
jgi:hypothetical protein